MEDQTHPGLQQQIEVIHLQADEHSLQSNPQSDIQITTEHDVQVTEEDLVKQQSPEQRRPRTLGALKCSKCYKRFKNPTALQQHVKLHRGSTLYRCWQCQETFRQLNKFLEHRDIHPPLRKKRKAGEANAFQIGEN